MSLPLTVSGLRPLLRHGASLALVACGLGAGAFALRAPGQPPSGDFTSTTIDVGVVVSDLERSVAFYTGALGFTELPGFTVDADFCTDAGLSDHQPLVIRVLALGPDTGATRLKLMAVPGVESKPSDNAFVHSQLGYSYLTVHVTDMDAALERLARSGGKPLAKGPVPARGGEIALSLVRDPDGNLIELLGPRKP